MHPWAGEKVRYTRPGCKWRQRLRKVSRGLKLAFDSGTFAEPGEVENWFYIPWGKGVRGCSSGPAQDTKFGMKLGVQKGTLPCKRELEINPPLLRLRGKMPVLNCGAGWEGKWSFLWEFVTKEGCSPNSHNLGSQRISSWDFSLKWPHTGSDVRYLTEQNKHALQKKPLSPQAFKNFPEFHEKWATSM